MEKDLVRRFGELLSSRGKTLIAPAVALVLLGTWLAPAPALGSGHEPIINGICGPINGVCGTASCTAVASAPTTNLCGDGSLPAVAGAGPWTWTCNGSGTPAGTNASCSAPLIGAVAPTAGKP